MALDVTVKITEATVAGELGFSIPLVLVSNCTEEVAYTECTKISEITELFGEDSDVYNIAKLIWTQTNAPSTIAVYGSTSDAKTAVAEVVSKDFRQLITVFGSGDTTTIADIAEYIETTEDKMYFVTVSTVTELATVTGYDRTVAFYYDLTADDTLVEPYAVAAIVGETAGRDAGTFTYKNLIISGLEPLELTDEQIEEIHTNGGITLLLKAGDIVTSEGKTTGGEFIDIIDSKDWIIQEIAYQSQQLLNNSDKLPYTNAGIASLENMTVNVLQTALSKGVIATDDDGNALYSVNFKKRSEMSDEDRKNRIYSGGYFTFQLEGAIHTAIINGELVI